MSLYFLSQPLVRASADPNAPLPSEFLLFAKGVNESCNGSVLFDERSVEKVLDQAKRHGVDFIVDLEHFSLFPRGENDRDARGWFEIEDRGGELWAVRVSWTQDGADRLRGRRQRYTSPAFYCDEWDDEQQLPRVTSLINVAICSMPATYGNMPLVASAQVDGRTLDVVRPSAYARERMANAAQPAPAPAAVEATPQPPRGADPTTTAPAPEAAPAPAAEAAPAEPAPATPAAVLTDAQLAEYEQLKRERAEREAAERRSLITELVGLGAEVPATAWSNGAPSARLAAEPLADLRSRVAALRAAKPQPSHKPPPTGGSGEEGLSATQQAAAAKIADPAHRARFVALCQSMSARK